MVIDEQGQFVLHSPTTSALSTLYLQTIAVHAAVSRAHTPLGDGSEAVPLQNIP